eukprot:CAMPEP_0197665614 /NCGR_PEP_ID=MMETSP1338-20131121/59748_1 /TAXON_ID=43686 ORGANISM="Pelagodinium beii, Strain RCC1491" /NCGR_SAMPLE_ID=MMETSP1338 /ASSEMBLY_ACC=CAM_ASM_000754 /LENGTH=230 /DNA_ID=CAMNT_0043244461 /DNA_START=108 /DNA_END=798 /DNA_ORIENTATION=+
MTYAPLDARILSSNRKMASTSSCSDASEKPSLAVASPFQRMDSSTSEGEPTVTEDGEGATEEELPVKEDLLSLEHLDKTFFLGTWEDSRGSVVEVRLFYDSSGEEQLMATLNTTRVIQLSMWQSLDGSWHCGDGKLDLAASTTKEIKWTFFDGRTSIWKKESASPPQQEERHILDDLLDELMSSRNALVEPVPRMPMGRVFMPMPLFYMPTQGTTLMPSHEERSDAEADV